MKTLTLSLKKQWFDKIKSGEKKEEYRECSEYWITRFANLCGCFEYKFVDHHRKMISCDHLNCNKLVFALACPASCCTAFTGAHTRNRLLPEKSLTATLP